MSLNISGTNPREPSTRPLSCTASQQLTICVLAYCVSFGIKEEDCSTLFQGLLTANKKNNEFNAAQKRKD